VKSLLQFDEMATWRRKIDVLGDISCGSKTSGAPSVEIATLDAANDASKRVSRVPAQVFSTSNAESAVAWAQASRRQR
jgi:hypothetical protein